MWLSSSSSSTASCCAYDITLCRILPKSLCGNILNSLKNEWTAATTNIEKKICCEVCVSVCVCVRFSKQNNDKHQKWIYSHKNLTIMGL